MSVDLSEGSMKVLEEGGHPIKPVLQVLEFKVIRGGTSNRGDRYRLTVWDGKDANPLVVLASQLNARMLKGEIKLNSIIRVEKYVCTNLLPDKRLMMILEFRVLMGGEKRRSSSFKTLMPFKTDFISSLFPVKTRWTIRARVTNKSSVNVYKNSKGKGKLFSLVFVDESGEIQATAFNKECEKFYQIFEENKVFYVRNFYVVTANKSFSNVKNDFELIFNGDSVVTPCVEKCSNLPTSKFDFVRINRLSSLPKDSIVDVIGICKNVGDVKEFFNKKTNCDDKKRDIYLIDQTKTEIILTLWGDKAEFFDGRLNPIVVVKNARVSDYSTCTLTMIHSSCLHLNPDIPEVGLIKNWFEREGSRVNAKSVSKFNPFGSIETDWKYLYQVTKQKFGDKANYFTTKASVVYIATKNCLYKGCDSDECCKKLIDQEDGMFLCQKCGKVSYNFKWRLLLHVVICDFSGELWVTCFHESAEFVIGKTADELVLMKRRDVGKFRSVFHEAMYKEFIFRLKSGVEKYNNETKIQTTVVAVKNIDYREYNRKLISNLQD